MGESANKFMEKLLGFSLGPILVAFISFLITPITTWLISPTEFGKASMFVLALNISSTFIYFGIDKAFVREYNSKENKKELLWSCFYIPFTSSVIIGIVYFIFKNQISYLLFGVNEQFVIIILACHLPIRVIYRFNLLIIRMEEKGISFSLINIFEKIVNVILLFSFLYFYEKSFKSIILSQSVSVIIVGLYVVYKNRDYWSYKFKINNTVSKKVLRYGLPLIPTSLLNWVLNSMDRIALKNWSSLYEVGLYAVAFKIVMILTIFQYSFSDFWAPISFRWYEEDVPKEKFELVSHKLTVLLVLLFGFIVISKDFIILILGEGYSSSAIMVPFLLFYPVMYTINLTTGRGVYFLRKTKYIVYITGIAALTNIVGNYFLVPSMGGIGASIATGISYIVFFLLSALLSRKLWYKFKLKFYFVNIGLMLAIAFSSVVIKNKIFELCIYFIMIFYNMNHLIYIFNLVTQIFKKILLYPKTKRIIREHNIKEVKHKFITHTDCLIIITENNVFKFPLNKKGQIRTEKEILNTKVIKNDNSFFKKFTIQFEPIMRDQNYIGLKMNRLNDLKEIDFSVVENILGKQKYIDKKVSISIKLQVLNSIKFLSKRYDTKGINDLISNFFETKFFKIGEMHGDFHFGNILIKEECYYLIDFERFDKEGIFEYDLLTLIIIDLGGRVFKKYWTDVIKCLMYDYDCIPVEHKKVIDKYIAKEHVKNYLVLYFLIRLNKKVSNYGDIESDDIYKKIPRTLILRLDRFFSNLNLSL